MTRRERPSPGSTNVSDDVQGRSDHEAGARKGARGTGSSADEGSPGHAADPTATVSDAFHRASQASEAGGSGTPGRIAGIDPDGYGFNGPTLS